jgi:glycerol-3-phosphate dehydrogenase
MRKIETEVLVIGGGATGTGIARDLAMRGFKTVMVERGDLTQGTSGRYHGLLHAGGRYVIKDPLAAQECIEENMILRRIMPQCIEDTGGFFVVTPWDDPEYAPRFVEGCKKAGIPVEDVPISQMLKEEPLLNPRITHCYRVPDGSADSFIGAKLNAESARQHGALTLPYHQVTQLIRSGSKVTGARCHDLVNDEEVEILADMVVNASGAWAGQIASMVGIEVEIIPGKGTMVAVNHRVVNTVINRCKIPGDGDIIVPAHTVAVIGTTDIKVKDPDHYSIEPWEIELMLEEGEKLVPGFKDMRMLRAWAGVRPLYQEKVDPNQVKDNRNLTRAYVLLDHETRDGIAGFITITSGKWTTYRKMAEVTVDLVCSKLSVRRECRTALELLPGAQEHGYHTLGMRLKEIEDKKTYGHLLCECELATYEDVAQAITQGEAKTIDDIRRTVRLGMGPCQGGFCTFRAAGMLHKLRHPPVQQSNVAIRDYLQERWKGLLPILWGQQLRQERLDELIYLNILNADHLPGPKGSRFAPLMYEPGSQKEAAANLQPNVMETIPQTGARRPTTSIPPDPKVYQPDVLVIGAGLAGLFTAWQAAQRGKRVKLISKGWGATHWNTGCVDVLGYLPGRDEPILSLRDSLRQFIQGNPRHPYALAGLDQIESAINTFKDLCSRAGYPLQGSLEKNWLLPTSLGTLRPTCLAPETMTAGDLSQKTGGQPFLLVGFEKYFDFYADQVADNLLAQGFAAQGITLDLPHLREQLFVTSRSIAWDFENPDFRAEVAKALKPLLNGVSRVGFPAVLGLRYPLEVYQDMQERLGLPVFEIPTTPPSISGIRLANLLVEEIAKNGGRTYEGMQVTAFDVTDHQVASVWSESASRRKAHRANDYVLATGGILGGGIQTYYDGSIQEVIFGLPVDGSTDRSEWFHREFLPETSHPIYCAGIDVNPAFQPANRAGGPVFSNLYAVGTTLAGCDAIQERSFEGVCLVSGYLVGSSL